MQKAYALLGVAFIIVFGSAYVLFERAYAPTTDDESIVHSEAESMTLTLTSPEFTHNTSIPSRYTCDGENILPPLVIEGVPEGTGSLVLVMDDPDVPDEIKAARGITKFDHVAIYNIPADTELIDADAMPGTGANLSNFTYAYPLLQTDVSILQACTCDCRTLECCLRFEGCE